jgi:class 3 adenylate cyclase
MRRLLLHQTVRHQAVVLLMVGEFGGRIIDTAGDGILTEFFSVVNAVKCGVAIQSKMVERNAEIEPKRRMEFRIGVNIGDVICDEARIERRQPFSSPPINSINSVSKRSGNSWGSS